MEKEKIHKLFSYDELFAMVYLAVGHACFISAAKEYNDPKEGRRMIEEKIKETIALRWDCPDKEQVMR